MKEIQEQKLFELIQKDLNWFHVLLINIYMDLIEREIVLPKFIRDWFANLFNVWYDSDGIVRKVRLRGVEYLWLYYAKEFVIDNKNSKSVL